MRYQLELVGRYRLLEANNFDVFRTLVAAYGKDNPGARDLFHDARRFVERMFRNRWSAAQAELEPLAYLGA
jgi:hypothetical protein